ncbi:MAG: hypothetical protein HQL95_09120 [Magnetococcales bacterium]|nr:hypothetical protein [Magnetococcales bacterium]
MGTQKISIVAQWRNPQDRRYDNITVDLESSFTMRQFTNCAWIGQGYASSGQTVFWCDSREDAEIFTTRFKAIARFMEVTGWKPSRADRRFFGKLLYYQSRFGFDHTLIWRDAAQRIFVTTEPYESEARDLRKVNPELFVTKELPSEIGMWFPPSTKLFLVAKPNDLQYLEQAHERLITQWGYGA